MLVEWCQLKVKRNEEDHRCQCYYGSSKTPRAERAGYHCCRRATVTCGQANKGPVFNEHWLVLETLHFKLRFRYKTSVLQKEFMWQVDIKIKNHTSRVSSCEGPSSCSSSSSSSIIIALFKLPPVSWLCATMPESKFGKMTRSHSLKTLRILCFFLCSPVRRISRYSSKSFP